jgi:hypothetical protein
LNTNLYYKTDNATFTDKQDPAGQFKFMEDNLREAKAKGQSVNVVAHIPPGGKVI